MGSGETMPAHHLHLSTRFVHHLRQQQPGAYLQYEKPIHYPESRKATRPEQALIKHTVPQNLPKALPWKSPSARAASASLPKPSEGDKPWRAA